MHPNIHIIFCFLCSGQIAFAQSRFEEKSEFSINTIAETYIYTQKLDNKDDTQNEWKTNIALNYKFSDVIQLKTNTQINLNTVEKSRRFIEVREAYINTRVGKFNTSIGKQIVNWSGLTGWSAADIANTYQYYDFLDTEDEERGHWAFKSTFQHNNTQIAAVVIPFFRVSKLFLEDNRWINLPTETTISNTNVPLIFLNENTIRNYDELQIGLKLSTKIGNSQQTLLAYHGYNDIPVRALTIADQNPEDGLDYTLDLIYHKLQYLSWQSELYIGQWNLWTEANITRSRILKDDALKPHNFYNLIAGTDRSFELNNPEKQLSILLQYIYSFNTENVNYAPNDLDHVFNNAILARIRYQFNYKLKTELLSAFEFEKEGYYINPNLEYTVLNDLKILAGADILLGNRKSFFGNFQDNSRIRFALNYYF